MQSKGLLTKLAETIDAHRLELQNQRIDNATAESRPRVSHRGQRWLPTPGNVLFTVIMIVSLIGLQNSGAITLFAAPNTAAVSTSTIAYQGRLANSAGAPLTQTVNMSFRLYGAASGGTPLWEEQWTGANSVRVSDGLFNVMLGSVTPIPQAVIVGNSNLFLGITVGTDNEMTPRVQLGSVPFATQALTVPDGSITPAKLSFAPLVPNEVGNVWMSGDLFMNNHTISSLNLASVGNIYGYGDTAKSTEIHMPGGANTGNIYFNWHKGGGLYYGGGKAQPLMSINPDGNLWVKGELQAAGAKPAIVETASYGKRKLYAVESATVRFMDEGLATLENGLATVNLDPIFLETIEGNYLVHVTPYGDAQLYVAALHDTYFEVRSREPNVDISFAWSLSAYRRGYADQRLAEVTD